MLSKRPTSRTTTTSLVGHINTDETSEDAEGRSLAITGLTSSLDSVHRQVLLKTPSVIDAHDKDSEDHNVFVVYKIFRFVTKIERHQEPINVPFTD